MKNSRYNKSTIGAQISVKLIERDGYNDKSIWEVSLDQPLDFAERLAPVGATFKYEGAYDEDEDEARRYIMNRGILDACNIDDGYWERDYLEEKF